MNGQLYTAASGLLVEERRMDLVSNNLANLSTPGFRARRAFATVYGGALARAGGANAAANRSVALAGAYEVPGPGPTRNTGRALDVALNPDELLAVRTQGGRRYTRAGSLDISPAGELVDGAGNPLLLPDGKTIRGLSGNVEIAADGRVLDGGNDMGRLLVVRDTRGNLVPEGSGLYRAAGGDGALEVVDDPILRPGWLEGSATNALDELIQLIESQRAFESYQKLVSLTMNDVNRTAVTQIAG
jgi:flagellar basal body rod protein FlgG